jgi:hypothetical protein
MSPDQIAVIVLSVVLIAVAALRLGDLKDRKILVARIGVLVEAVGELTRLHREREARAPVAAAGPLTPPAAMFPAIGDVDEDAPTRMFERPAEEPKAEASMPVFFDCGCSRIKVRAGLCDIYDKDGTERPEEEQADA